MTTPAMMPPMAPPLIPPLLLLGVGTSGAGAGAGTGLGDGLVTGLGEGLAVGLGEGEGLAGGLGCAMMVPSDVEGLTPCRVELAPDRPVPTHTRPFSRELMDSRYTGVAMLGDRRL